MQRLLAFCERVASPIPPHSRTRILEMSHPRVTYVRGWSVPADALHSASDFAPRFRELLESGYSWINLSAYGIVDDILVVGLELPHERGNVPVGFTSVNYSGPARGAAGTPSWKLALTIVA